MFRGFVWSDVSNLTWLSLLLLLFIVYQWQELESQLKLLNKQFETDVVALQRAYTAKQRSLETAIKNLKKANPSLRNGSFRNAK